MSNSSPLSTFPRPSRRECRSFRREPVRNPASGRRIAPFKRTWVKLAEDCPPKTPRISGMANIGASCYADSVLMALLARPHPFITRYLLTQKVPLHTESRRIFHITDPNPDIDRSNKLQVQASLQKLAVSIRYGAVSDSPTCATRELRTSMSGTKPPQAFHRRGEQDAREYLQFIFDLFGANVARQISRVSVTNDIVTPVSQVRTIPVSTTIDRLGTPINFIDYFVLNAVPAGTPLSEFVTITDDAVLDERNTVVRRIGTGVKHFRRRILKKTVVDTPYLVFYVSRQNPGTGAVTRKSVVPDEEIELPSGRVLTLIAVVLYTNHHYLADLLLGSRWYQYDDMSAEISTLGRGIGNLVQSHPDPRRHGVLYFYG